MNFTFAPELLVAGRSKTDRKVVYIAKDIPSGGYWYWTSDISAAAIFTDDQMAMINSSLNNSPLLHAVEEAFVLIVTRQVGQEIPVGTLPEVVRNKRLEELREQQRKLEQELKELEGQ